jgi:RimJ/RimL family protein N-acetyltransferase
MIGLNGYEPQELSRYFSAGALWFGVQEKSRFLSVCFIYQNHDRVWEIAGVYTDPNFRGKGLEKKVVTASLQYLLSGHLIPRYQAKWDNIASIRLAKSLGLVEFLKVSNYLIAKDTASGKFV